MNDLSDGKTIGRTSGLGWAVGYVGGGLCLTLNLLMIQHPAWFHLPAENHWPVRATFFVVGVWWLIFTLQLLIWVPENRVRESEAGDISSYRAAWRRMAECVGGARRFRKNLLLFLIAYLLYNDAIETVIVIAALFASRELEMGQGEIVTCFLMIQFVAVLGSLLFGHFADRWSNKRSLQIALLVWSAILIWTMFMKSRGEFWLAGAVIAIVLGGSQSVSRSLFGKMIPAGEAAQHYGFFGLSGKISSAAGPFLFGLVNEISGSIRWAIFSLFAVLILGQCLLCIVREPGPGVAEDRN